MACDPHLRSLIERELDDLVAIRRDLHAHPQMAFEETYAAAVVERELGRLGIPCVTGLAKTGVVGWIGEGDAAVALRADMDALPITEQTRVPWASQHKGVMHACGHDGHTTTLLGAARVLVQLKDRLPRPVKLVFQPGEESVGGARHLVEAGVLTAAVGGMPVRSIFGLHGMPQLKLGQYATRVGPFMAATHDFRITIHGRGGHAAMPQYTVDPVPAAAQVVTALQTIVSRSVDPADQAVLSITQMHAGEGDATNVIPGEARLGGTFRTLVQATADAITHRMRRVAESTAAAHGCRADVVVIPGYPATVNDPDATALAMDVARETLGDDGVLDVPHAIMGAEDFAYYGQQTPACFGFFGVCPTDRADYPPLHHPQYDFNDDALPQAVALMCGFALRGGV